MCLLELKCVPLKLHDMTLDLQDMSLELQCVHPGAEVCALELHCCRMGPLELKCATPGVVECAPGATVCP